MYIASVDDTTMAMTGIGQYDDAGEEHCTYTEQYGQCTDCCNEVVTLSLEAITHLVVVVEGYWDEDDDDEWNEGQIHIAAHQIDTCLDNSCDQFGDDDDDNDDQYFWGCSEMGLSSDFGSDGCDEDCHCCTADGSCGECEGDHACFVSEGHGYCRSCYDIFAGDDASASACASQVGDGYTGPDGQFYDNTCSFDWGKYSKIIISHACVPDHPPA